MLLYNLKDELFKNQGKISISQLAYSLRISTANLMDNISDADSTLRNTLKYTFKVSDNEITRWLITEHIPAYFVGVIILEYTKQNTVIYSHVFELIRELLVDN